MMVDPNFRRTQHFANAIGDLTQDIIITKLI